MGVAQDVGAGRDQGLGLVETEKERVEVECVTIEDVLGCELVFPAVLTESSV